MENIQWCHKHSFPTYIRSVSVYCRPVDYAKGLWQRKRSSRQTQRDSWHYGIFWRKRHTLVQRLQCKQSRNRNKKNHENDVVVESQKGVLEKVAWNFYMKKLEPHLMEQWDKVFSIVGITIWTPQPSIKIKKPIFRAPLCLLLHKLCTSLFSLISLRYCLPRRQFIFYSPSWTTVEENPLIHYNIVWIKAQKWTLLGISNQICTPPVL